MGKIYNFLKNVFQNLLKENNVNNNFIPILLVLLTVLLNNIVNNIALGLLLLTALIFFKKENLKFQINFIIPILLYCLMLASFFWSINREITSEALLKEIPIFIIPLVFLISKDLSKQQKQKAIKCYSYSIVVFVIYYLIRAIIRYFILNDTRVFFYHGENQNDFGLVPKLLNAIHVSIFVAVAFFHFFTKEIKNKSDNVIMILLFGFIVLLSSKNIIFVILLLMLIYVFFFSKTAHKMRLKNLIVFGLLIAFIFSIGKIKETFQIEFKTNTNKSLSTNVIEGIPQNAHYVSIKEAWTNKTFTPNDYFPGTVFRVYQLRIFIELMEENNAFLTGLGLNASYSKIKEKAIQYNVFMGDDGNDGYQTKNFHNQYVQIFAELGALGFILLSIILIINVKNAYKSKDFVHFAFAFLMISLFLTESFLWRQRGVVFFTMMYCLFNSGIIQNNSEVE